MLRRSKQDWLAVIKEQEASGLSVAEYARRHNISIGNLYARRSDLKANGASEINTSSFLEVTQVSQCRVSQSDTFSVEIGTAKLQLPINVSADWLGQVIRTAQA